MRPLVYIDGKDGTTGLQIYDRLAGRTDIELLLIGEDKRKDPAERKKLLNAADLVFLCLPDDAAREAVFMIENPDTRVIDASTAHRTAPGWTYGFPEVRPGQRAAVASSRRIANPGCHATGFISIVSPLVQMGILPADTPLSCFSLTGYSGGGKKMIAQYESPDREALLGSPCPYGLTQSHQHLPEMQAVCGLAQPPVFVPIVDDYYKGMAATVPFHMHQLRGISTLRQVREALAEHYAAYPGDAMVEVAPLEPPTARLYGAELAGSDRLRLVVAGNDQRFTVTALFDNLGKGASGAAVQNMNLVLGFAETTGLSL